MATGVPGVKRTPRSPLALTYEGKRPEAALLAEPPRVAFAPLCGPPDATGRLYFGDNLEVLRALKADPAVAGQVRLVYIDPPFATRGVFHARGDADAPAYQDALGGGEYLEFLRARLLLLRELLADDGSLYLHLDDTMAFPAKVLLDEVFGAANFRNCIVRNKCNPKNSTRRAFGNVVDFILFYSKTADYLWNRPHLPWSEPRAREYSAVEPGTGRRYMKVPLHAPGVRGGETGGLWRGKPPPPGKHWQYPPQVLDAMDARGEISWSATGNPRRKLYLDQSPGVPVQDLWLDLKDPHNQNVRITGYPTEKNPALLHRILAASSKPGDLVLDCFAGSGTTLAVAAELGRRWIGADSSPLAIRTTLQRLFLGTARMGDFVGARRPAPARAPAGPPSLALLAGPEDPDAPELRAEYERLSAAGPKEPIP